MATFSRSALNNLTYKIIAAAIEVHRYLGPGLLESVYQRCMERELEGHPLGFKAQQPLKVDYKGMNIDCGFESICISKISSSQNSSQCRSSVPFMRHSC